VVGHEPDLSEWPPGLIGAGGHANLAFKKGGCCMIRFDEFPPKSPGQLVCGDAAPASQAQLVGNI